MSTYVLGDIHGCFDSLQNLLSLLPLNKGDQLWCVGDLINRGPDSLKVLQWAQNNDSWVQIILGNHELHFLACLYGAHTSSGDTLDDLLSLSKSEQKELCTWLRRQPILFEAKLTDRRIAMVHAGLNPEWSWTECKRRAQVIEQALQSDEGLLNLALAHPSRKGLKSNPQAELNSTYSHETRKSSHKKPKPEKAQWIRDLKWFTRVRTVDHNGKAIGWFKGNPQELPTELIPWFSKYQEQHNNFFPDMLYYGHWAAFGIQHGRNYYGLDSACIWGQQLTAVRVEDGEIFQVNNQNSSLTPKHLRAQSNECRD